MKQAKAPRFHLEKILFFLILLFLPTQLGRHFWPNFSYVYGIRIDYLSPTIYLTDILVGLLFILWFISKFKISNLKFLPAGKQGLISNWTLPVLVAFLVSGILLSKSPMAGWYGLLKFLEFVFFAVYIKDNLKRIQFDEVVGVFMIGIIFESILAILQFSHQGSLGGIFYFFGERLFSSSTPGIANTSLNNQLILRPYATFPHPNVLAGYLLIAMTMIIFNFQFSIFNFKKFLYPTTLIVGTVALFLTMSRVAIVLWLLVIGLWMIVGFSLLKKNKLIFVFLLFSFFFFLFYILFLSPVGQRLTSINFPKEVEARETLVKSSIIMIRENPIFGVGVNNFFINLPNPQKMSLSNLFSYMQPVHNIFLLIAAQTGIVGLGIFLWFIAKAYKQIRNRKSIIHNSKFILLSMVLVLGLFDHYFLTIQQGQLLLSFVLGLAWSKIKL